MNNCITCQNENLTDYPVCPSCSTEIHFLYRPCRCDSCAPYINLVVRRESIYSAYENAMPTGSLRARLGQRLQKLNALIAERELAAGICECELCVWGVSDAHHFQMALRAAA